MLSVCVLLNAQHTTFRGQRIHHQSPSDLLVMTNGFSIQIRTTGMRTHAASPPPKRLGSNTHTKVRVEFSNQRQSIDVLQFGRAFRGSLTSRQLVTVAGNLCCWIAGRPHLSAIYTNWCWWWWWWCGVWAARAFMVRWVDYICLSIGHRIAGALIESIVLVTVAWNRIKIHVIVNDIYVLDAARCSYRIVEGSFSIFVYVGASC